MSFTAPTFPYFDVNDGSGVGRWGATALIGSAILSVTSGKIQLGQSGAGVRNVVRPNNPNVSHTDGEIAAVMLGPTASTPKSGLGIRATAASSGSGYFLQETTGGNSSSWGLYKRISGTETLLATFAPSGLSSNYDGGSGVGIVWRYTGSRHEFKIWDFHNAEPVWSYSIANVFVFKDSSILTAGESGILINGSALQNVQFDEVRIASFDGISGMCGSVSASNSNDTSSLNGLASTSSLGTYTSPLSCFKNEPLLIAIFNSLASDPPGTVQTVSVTGDGGALTISASPLISTVYYNQGGDRERLTIYSAMANANVSGATVSVQFSLNQTGASILITRFNAAKTTSSDGSAAFTHMATNIENTSNVTTLSVTLATFTASTSVTSCIICHGSNDTHVVESGSGYISAANITYTSPSTALASHWTRQQDTTPTPTWTTGAKAAIFGCEVLLGTSPGPATTDPTPGFFQMM